ncbi:MAG TPA: plasmid replication protein RepC, partial [Acetobacteraceae bacterium]
GLMRMRRSPNGKRYGHRGKDGRIRIAYGFDLSPLAERQEEFERLAAEFEARRAEGKRLRREITSLRNEVLSMADLAAEQQAEGAEWQEAAERAQALWVQRGRDWDPLRLVPIASRLKALAVLLRERLAPSDLAVNNQETGPVGPEYRPHHTATNQASIPEGITTAGREGLPLDKHRSRDGGAHRQSLEVATRTERSSGSAGRCSALQGFPATPEFVLRIAPAFRDWVTGSKPDWPELVEAADHVRSRLGISAHAWGQACVVLGRMEASVAVAAISARHAAGQVRSPGGLLRKLVEAHQGGDLRLDRTLFGLTDKMGGLRPSEMAKAAPRLGSPGTS